MLKHKARPVLATLFAVLMVLVVAPRPALADSVKAPSVSQFKGTITLYRSSATGLGHATYRADAKAEKANPITDITSTNPKVADAYASNYYSNDNAYYSISIRGYKKGTSKISFKYKGKTYRATVKVVNYKSPIKSFKIGSTNFKSKFKKQNYTYNIKLSQFAKLANKPINITPAKGWKVRSIEVTNAGYTSKEKFVDKTRTIKNGAKIPKVLSEKKVPNRKYGITVTLQNTKTKGTQTIMLWNGSMLGKW